MKLSPWLLVLCFTASVLAGPEERIAEIRGEDRYYYEGKTCVRHLSRGATTTGGKDPAARLAKAEWKPVRPGEESKRLWRRAVALLDANTAEAVLKAVGLE